MDPQDLTPEAQSKILTLLDQLLNRRSSVDAQRLAARIQELQAMGIYDKPKWVGIPSAVQQYAIHSLFSKNSETPMIFVTKHEPLLQLAAHLQERYGLKPVTMEIFLHMTEKKKSAG